MFDYLVIGKGLFGSAATRHLSQFSGNVAVIGPDEPADAANHNGVFASHYDQGRIVSATGPDVVWNALDRLSISQYSTIEQGSGICFYTPNGLIRVCHRDAPLANPQNRRKSYRYEDDGGIAKWPQTAVQQTYQLQFPDGYDIYVEGAPSGYINPRDMIRGQLALAQKAGATVIRETAVALHQHTTHLTITTQEGHSYEAKKMLIATGAYANCLDVLPRKLDIRIKSETIILARVPDSEAERLHNMPPVTYEVDSADLDGIYLLPPIRYPDGRNYLKMGCDTRADKFLHSFEEMSAWMTAGDSDVVKAAMQAAIEAIIPGINVTDWQTGRCLVTYTPQRKPFIDAVVPGRLYVAVAGNGTGAHPSDGIGRLAADLMVHDEWRSELDHDIFRAQFADS
jgi:sarcosine oxidase